MPEREQRRIPEWAERKRAIDLSWIGENLPQFWEAAHRGYEADGPGALVVDTTIQPTGAGHPFAYVTQEQIQQFGGRDEIRMVAAYDPSWELVIVLLKPQDRISSYRVGIPGQRPNATTR